MYIIGGLCRVVCSMIKYNNAGAECCTAIKQQCVSYAPLQVISSFHKPSTLRALS